MRPNKEETVAMYAEEYLKGKSEERRQKFNDASLNNKYAAIMAWRRKQEAASKKSGGTVVTGADVLKHASGLASLIKMANDIKDAERERIYAALDEARQTLDGFNRIRNTREFEELKRVQEEIQRRMEALRADGVNE
ncbi:MAG: hypothetical protein HDR80_02130 [Bacteroides sp.]|nr:hypothetical protein [Bacteroides sp.]